MAGSEAQLHHFLDELVEAFVRLEGQDPVNTADFVTACQRLLPIFDGLGSIFAAFPKQDLQDKVGSAIVRRGCGRGRHLTAAANATAANGYQPCSHKTSWRAEEKNAKAACFETLSSANRLKALRLFGPHVACRHVGMSL